MTQQVRLDWHGARVREAEHAGAVKGLRKAAEHLLGESRQQVPLEEATLERSGTTSVDAGQLQAAVSYDTPYAVRQHEELTYRHDAGRKAKYLEDPFRDQMDTMRDLIAADIRRSLGT